MKKCDKHNSSTMSTGEVTHESAASQQPKQYRHYIPSAFRQLVRNYQYSGPTNGVCLGYMQCHLVVLDIAFALDFIAFCDRNTNTCPLLEVCVDDEHSLSYKPTNFATSDDVDLRTDLSKYSIYRNGEWERDTLDVVNLWPQEAAAFLIGSTYSYHGSLINAGIPIRSNDANQSIPYYVTNIPCHPVGPFRGNVVVGMTPTPCTMVAHEISITSEYPYANGTPICVGGDGSCIGITDISTPDCGTAIQYNPMIDVPIFHPSGTTVQHVLLSSDIPFAITSAVGCMFVTDRFTPDYLSSINRRNP